MNRKIISIIVFIFSTLFNSTWVIYAQTDSKKNAEKPISKVAIPELKSRITDLTNSLDPNTKNDIGYSLAKLEAEKGAQVAILIIPSTKPETIEQYSIRVVEKWKLGRRGIDDGVLLLIAKKDRRLRIEVGYGLEGTLTDATSRLIIDKIITPRFRSQQFSLGIKEGTNAIIEAVKGQILPKPNPARKTHWIPEAARFWIAAAIVIGLLVLFFILAMRISIPISGLVILPIGFALGYLIYGSWQGGMGVDIAITVFLLYGWLESGGGGGGGSYSSSSYSSSSSGGGSSSYSGGGGSFGGGGASGSW